jgi:ribosomal protein S18 acetylase RimI-like enzyme
MIRKATIFDLPQIWQLREETRMLLKDREIDQWQHSNPSYQTIEKDIHLQEFYVYDENAIILGMVAIKSGIEKTYNVIYEGAWGYEMPYLTVHRLAVKRHLLGQSIARQLMKHAELVAQELGVSYIRIDTHETNRYAIRLFESMGYIKRGWIMLEQDKGDLKRLAYDKKI